MTEAEEEVEVSLRRRTGKIVIVVGILLLVLVIVLGMLTSIVSAYYGPTESARAYVQFNTIATPVVIFGVLLVVAGLIAILLPEGQPQDGVWIMQLGPFGKTT
ncbi:MAG: hypothetical protein ACFFFO_07070 [Candidatus Thorarchaeota archaeon]